jgi:predicted Zn-dependent protease
LFAGTVPAQELPAFGGASSDAISSTEELRLGRQFMRSARRQMDFWSDAETLWYVRDLGARLLAAIDRSPEDFTFLVVRDPNLNAFAVPGGFISVHTGLIVETASESELASVMAHEIAHITQRHLPRMIARAKERSIPAAAAMIAAILVGGQMGSAAMVSANAALAADQLRYSRDFEKEADAIGIRILADSDFEPGAMPAFFQKLQKTTMLQANEVPEYLRTHPLSVSRIADSEARAAGYSHSGRESNRDYLMIKARVRALTSSDPVRAAGYFDDLDKSSADKSLAARYGQGLALMAAGQYDQSGAVFEQLQSEYPDNQLLELAVGQLALNSGRTGEAMERFGALYERAPNNMLSSRYYAESLVLTGRLADARKVLRRWQRNDPGNPETYRLLSRVEGELGRQAESFQARAEYFALLFEINRALEELEKARSHSRGNYYLSSSIDARAKELQEELVRFKEDELPR